MLHERPSPAVRQVVTTAALPVTLDDIVRAGERIRELVRRTPVVRAAMLSERVGVDVHLKLESLQDTGSFKVRGAANRLLALAARDSAAGVVTFSTGNHGRAVAHVGAQLDVPVTVCVGGDVPAHKLDALRASGAELHVEGPNQDAAAAAALRLSRERGLEVVPPFDDVGVVAGQGTIGTELLEDLPDVGTVVVPLSGGGLISGMAVALKSMRPQARIIGVSAERCAAMWASQRAGKPVEVSESDTLADSLRGGIGSDNRVTFAIVRRLVDDLVTVDEHAIADAMAYAMRAEGLVLEGAAVVGIAALLSGRVDPRLGPGPAAAVVTGRNVALEQVLDACRVAPKPS
jgi:threonine dehydratase